MTNLFKLKILQEYFLFAQILQETILNIIKKQKEFIEYYEKLMQETPLSEPILFGDGVHPTQVARLVKTWSKKSFDKIIKTNAGRTRVNIFGAFNLESLELHYKTYETINSASIIDYFKYLETCYPGAPKIHVIVDQAGYLTSKELKEFLKTSKINVHYLPPHSPNLNPIERLWKIMHEFVSNNKVYENAKAFKKSLFNFLTNTIKEIPEVLRERVTDHFCIIE